MTTTRGCLDSATGKADWYIIDDAADRRATRGRISGVIDIDRSVVPTVRRQCRPAGQRREIATLNRRDWRRHGGVNSLYLYRSTHCCFLFFYNKYREHWIQRITFAAAETNAACSRRTHGQSCRSLCLFLPRDAVCAFPAYSWVLSLWLLSVSCVSECPRYK